ncbi:hypothetical protein KNJ79_05470 [Sphingopyxis indica]|uniref:DUF7940 domain-containing protein n=1 Tax=Sphingopyxis indica TaxID=436663 RepID=UPI002938EFBB|nr:hypothetical protein [Sphingopyxis indica]WOF44383.1 hypothetical protein KNJ79_05470 [Sphingopyxis indica]
MKISLIDEWRDAWRYASVWAAGAGLSILTVWNMMPDAVRERVPDWIEILVGGALWGLVFLARVTKKKEKTSG